MTYQKCPVCNGTGLVSHPPYIAGDVSTYASSSTGPYTCNVCGGNGLILGLVTTPNPTVEFGTYFVTSKCEKCIRLGSALEVLISHIEEHLQGAKNEKKLQILLVKYKKLLGEKQNEKS